MVAAGVFRANTALPRPVVKRPERRCVHCRDWIEPVRLAERPDVHDCTECADELERGVIRL